MWDSPVICSSDGVACDYTNENLIDQLNGVPTVDICREFCLDIDDCQFFSYFDETATPFPGFCELFKSCETVNNCSNCYTENIDCGRTCGTNVIGNLDENVLDVTPNIQAELECKALCIKNVTCKFYTYFLPNDTLFHSSCVLLTEFVYPAQPCSTCISGPVDCNGCSGSLAMDGESSQSLMLTNVSQTSEISIQGWGSCNLTILVVGGGGYGANYGGGGSGYLEYRSLQVSGGTLMTAQVGNTGQSSSLIISGGDTVTAEPGVNGGNGKGGDGYSGGGGSGRGSGSSGRDGGSDGGDGGDSWYSWVAGDISMFIFTTWSLVLGDNIMVATGEEEAD